MLPTSVGRFGTPAGDGNCRRVGIEVFGGDFDPRSYLPPSVARSALNLSCVEQPLSPNTPVFLGDGAGVSFEEARVAVLSMPLEATVSYGGGTAGGPAGILEASTQVELYDEQLGFEPYRAGIWTDPDPIDTAGPIEGSLERLTRRVGESLDAGKFVVTLGGEHSLTPAAVAAAAARHDGLVLVQLDAHADLRESYEGSPHSHACAVARSLDHVAEVRALGIRSYSVEEAERIRAGIPGYRVLHGWEMARPGWAKQALEGLAGRPVYLTVDVDYFDPALIPATGTPEPGGPDWWETISFLTELFEMSQVVACDAVELAPAPGQSHADFTVARLVHKLIGLHARSLKLPGTGAD